MSSRFADTLCPRDKKRHREGRVLSQKSHSQPPDREQPPAFAEQRSWSCGCNDKLGVRTGGQQNGYTLIELMITVAIVAILAAVAYSAFGKSVKRSKASEVASVIGEMKQKQELYKSEFGAYLQTGTNEGSVWPTLTASEPVTKSIEPRPAAWVSLGFNPGRALYCGYVAIAGDSTITPSGWGDTLIPNTGDERQKPWFYVIAECDWNRSSATNSKYGMSGTQTTLVTQNEGK